MDIPELAVHELNGRQIKNVVQLALALARQEAEEEDLEACVLRMHHLRTTVDITTAFIAETMESM